MGVQGLAPGLPGMVLLLVTPSRRHPRGEALSQVPLSVSTGRGVPEHGGDEYVPDPAWQLLARLGKRQQFGAGDLARERLGVADREERVLVSMDHERRGGDRAKALAPAVTSVQGGEGAGQ